MFGLSLRGPKFCFHFSMFIASATLLAVVPLFPDTLFYDKESCKSSPCIMYLAYISSSCPFCRAIWNVLLPKCIYPPCHFFHVGNPSNICKFSYIQHICVTLLGEVSRLLRHHYPAVWMVMLFYPVYGLGISTLPNGLNGGRGGRLNRGFERDFCFHLYLY